jgi:hypothetical protein
MNKTETDAAEIETHRGLVGFFDVLGYKSILENNQAREAALVIKHILETTRKFQDANDYIETLIQQTLSEHVVFGLDPSLCFAR